MYFVPHYALSSYWLSTIIVKSAIRQRNCQRSVHTSICLIIGASGLVHYCDVTCNCVIFSRKHNYISMPLWTRLISIYSSIVFYWLVQFTIDVSVPYANGIWDKHSEATLKFHRRFGIIVVRLRSNRRKILSYQHPISWLGDFKKTGGKTSICKMMTSITKWWYSDCGRTLNICW